MTIPETFAVTVAGLIDPDNLLIPRYQTAEFWKYLAKPVSRPTVDYVLDSVRIICAQYAPINLVVESFNLCITLSATHTFDKPNVIEKLAVKFKDGSQDVLALTPKAVHSSETVSWLFKIHIAQPITFRFSIKNDELSKW